MRIFRFFRKVIFISQFFGLHLVSTGSTGTQVRPGTQAADRQKCSFLYQAEIDLLGSSRPCLIACKRANRKCKICTKKSGRRRDICLWVHKQRYVLKCKICMNPHHLTENQIKRITSLNDLKLGSK